MENYVYTKDELNSMGNFKIYDKSSSEAAFLLGGIGTGNISLGARGELRDMEIFNTPAKGVDPPFTFFSIWTKEQGKTSKTRVLESKINPPYTRPNGLNPSTMSGLPRFETSTLKGEYPMSWVTLNDDILPVEVILEAFTPFIPLNPDDSGIPVAIFKYKVKNKTKKPVDVSIAGSIPNIIGFNGFDILGIPKPDYFKNNTNEFIQENNLCGVFMSSDLPSDHLKYGNMSLVTTNPNTTTKPNWYKGTWFDCIHDFWDDFSEDGKLSYESNLPYESPTYSWLSVGSVSAYDTLEAGEEKEFKFMLTWYFPNRINDWYQDRSSAWYKICSKDPQTTQNYYGKQFKSSWHAAKYTVKNYDRLYNDTIKFHKSLFESTLPDYVIDAAASNITVIRSTTCFRLESGKFFGWEGSHATEGSCPGNCTHVWNYENTLAFLFPSLERDMRTTDFNVETDENGKMSYRQKRIFGYAFDYHPAADGQLGTIIQLYRDWKLSGDTEFLKSLWDNAKKALDFAFTYWDSDCDYVLDNQQHNTYDIEFYGPNSLTNSMFYGALKAATEIAKTLGDINSADKYEKALKLGAERMDYMLFNGEYYIQNIDDVNKYKYQYGKGCLSDQVFGQLQAHVAGLGYILPEDHIKKAIYSVFQYNFKTDFSNHHNVQRTYVLNDEKGLLLCSWPNGGRPKLPFIYSDEVWTGIEYQVAAHLIFEGFIEEGLTLVKSTRERHDGIRRNPWNEVECGNHYVRSMASWNLVLALSGYKYDLVKGEIEFNPVINQENFKCFFSCGIAWGTFSQKLNNNTCKYDYKINVLYGSLEGITIKANGVNI